MKSLLYEAFQKGPQELLYVVPFVAKVMDSCANSKVFRPYNPWTMAIMNVLAELHNRNDLKLNLKFEIEVLCKTLQIDMNVRLAAFWLPAVSCCCRNSQSSHFLCRSCLQESTWTTRSA